MPSTQLISGAEKAGFHLVTSIAKDNIAAVTYAADVMEAHSLQQTELLASWQRPSNQVKPRNRSFIASF